MQRSRITCGALAMAAGLVLGAPAAGQGYWYNSQDSAQNQQAQNQSQVQRQQTLTQQQRREQMQRQEELRRQRAQSQARQERGTSSNELYFDARQDPQWQNQRSQNQQLQSQNQRARDQQRSGADNWYNQPSQQEQRWNQQQYRSQNSRAMLDRQRQMELQRWNAANNRRDRNPYGVGDDVADDKWDTGLWDMGEYDVPRRDQNRDRWFGSDEGGNNNPYGVGRDVFDDKWDTGLTDMGEYNARDYPQQYQRDRRQLQQQQFHRQYGVQEPEFRRERQGQLRDDDVWDPNRDRGMNDNSRWYDEARRDAQNNRRDESNNTWFGDDDRAQNRNNTTQDRDNSWFGDRDTTDGGNRWLGTDRASENNPYGQGRDIFDDKWDTGLDDMGEYNAWDYPEQYRMDLELLRRGEFHSRYGVPMTQDRQERGGQLRDDDQWDGSRPWYQRGNDRNQNPAIQRRNDWW